MTGQLLKEQGQQLALFNAGEGWAAEALDKLAAFCRVRKSLGMSKFRLEEFREVAELSGWSLPTSHKAWGALPKVAMKHQIIAPTNEYQAATSKRTHAHPVRVWMAL